MRIHTLAAHGDSPHIDIYDNSEVQPPSYLNVKDAPEDSDAYKSESNYSTDITDNVKNVCGQSESCTSDSNADRNVSDQEILNKNNISVRLRHK